MKPRLVRARRRRQSFRFAGFTLIEVLIAIGVLSVITMLLYGAFAGLKQSRDGITRVGDRYREGRIALEHITRELQSAYISNHVPINQQLAVVKTAFVATSGSPADRLDFNTFAYRRLDRDSKESDQAEISYFGSPNPDNRGVFDLARRVNPRLDAEPTKGGRVDVLATDIDLFDLSYLDALSGQWVDTWDTRQALTGQPNRLPLQVKIVLVLNGGKRSAAGRGRETIRFTTKVELPIQKPLTFAIQ